MPAYLYRLVPLYLQGTSSKTPSECLKPAPKPVFINYVFSHVYDT